MYQFLKFQNAFRHLTEFCQLQQMGASLLKLIKDDHEVRMWHFQPLGERGGTESGSKHTLQGSRTLEHAGSDVPGNSAWDPATWTESSQAERCSSLHLSLPAWLSGHLIKPPHHRAMQAPEERFEMTTIFTSSEEVEKPNEGCRPPVWHYLPAAKKTAVLKPGDIHLEILRTRQIGKVRGSCCVLPPEPKTTLTSGDSAPGQVHSSSPKLHTLLCPLSAAVLLPSPPPLVGGVLFSDIIGDIQIPHRPPRRASTRVSLRLDSEMGAEYEIESCSAEKISLAQMGFCPRFRSLPFSRCKFLHTDMNAKN